MIEAQIGSGVSGLPMVAVRDLTLEKARMEDENRPVKVEAREQAQIGLAVYVRTKFTPRLASASRWGIDVTLFIKVDPNQS